MRAGPLSERRVIDLLNRNFVCVYTATEDYVGEGKAPVDERGELQRIRQEGRAKKLSVGTVHAFVLTPEAWSKLLPTGDVNPGDSWELDRDVTARVLTYFYPQTENNDASTARIEKQSLTARALTVKDGLVTARIDGFVRMHHVFYPGRKDAQPLEADVVGVLTFASGKPPSLQLTTTRAVHGARTFNVAVR